MLLTALTTLHLLVASTPAQTTFPAPPDSIVAKAFLIEERQREATFLVVVENASPVVDIDVPIYLERFVTVTRHFADVSKGISAFKVDAQSLCSAPNYHLTQMLRPGYCYGVPMTVRLEPGLEAVSFSVDLGDAYGRFGTEAVPLAQR